MATVIGSYLSPYVRKVLVCLDIKGVTYRIDPIVPFYGNAEFSAISPVRRIPVLIDDAVTLADSTVICEYLEDRYPEPALYPSEPAQRARARWLEEYADSRMGEVLIWGLFNQRVINRFVWGEQADQARLDRTLDVDVPQILDYLETQLPPTGWLFGQISVADIAIASFFRNAAFVGFGIDGARWPVTSTFVSRVLGHQGFERLRQFEALSMRTPIARHREVLEAAGAPLTRETMGTAEPRRGILRI
jgi:glutathione S-transferase